MEQQVRECFEKLAQQDWIRQTERWWLKFAFHYTDIRNAAQILCDGCLYSREQAQNLRKIVVSSGSREVLSATDTSILDSVRLYFRPKTPTQFYAEGVHSLATLACSKFSDAHCPVPVFFLFDLAKVLTLPNSQFSDRGLGSHEYRLSNTMQELQALPWKQIYHNDRLNPEMAREIVARRNAEIVAMYLLPLKC